MAGTDSLLCGFTTTLMASPEGGTWSIVCDESAGVVEFEDVSSAETDVTVSECGTYAFVYTMNTLECAAEDTVKIGFEDPSSNVITGGLDVDLEVDYGCPSSAEGCSSSLTIAGVGSPPIFNWSMDLLQECCPVLYETTTQTPFGACEADIAVNVITSGECSVNEANWAGNQEDLVNVDSVIVSSNFFDIYLPLLGGLGGCQTIGGSCSFEDLPDVCQPDTTFLGYDTLVVNIPYATGAGQWHYVVNEDSLLTLQDTTQLPPPNDFATLIIEPNANYIGPDSITFSAWEKDIEGNLVSLFSQPLNLINKIQWVYQVDYAPDTLLIPIICGEEQDCNCGCIESGFFPAIDIPVPDLTCPPISLSFTPPDYYDTFWNYPANVFCEGDGSVIPNLTVEGCGTDYLFSGSDGLSIDPITGEIFIGQSGVGTHEIYLTTSGGYFHVMVIDILPMGNADFSLPSSVCMDDNNPIPTLNPNATQGGTWTINNGGTIDPTTGEIDLSTGSPGTYIVTYTTSDANGCEASQSQSLTVEPPPVPIGIGAVIVSMNSINFSWTDNPNISTYTISFTINGEGPTTITTNDNNFSLEGLVPGDEVTCTVTTNEANCNSVPETITIFTEDCPFISPVITNPNSVYCDNSTPILLEGIPSGGSFYGEGVQNSSEFDPTSVGLGNFTIFYDYTDPETGCNYTTSETITVNPAPNSDFVLSAYEICADEITPITLTYTGNAGFDATFNWHIAGSSLSGMGPHTIDLSSNWGDNSISLHVSENGCGSGVNVQFISIVEPISPVTITCSDSSTDMVSFNWNEIVGATSYDVFYTINGGNPVATTIVNNSFEVNGLNPQDEVEISVVALSNNSCGSSEITTQICVAQSCPPIQLSIDNLSNEYCSNEASTALTANIGGGIFYINGAESSILEPAILGEGIHLVEYILTQENCTYNTEITVNIENPIEALTINCGNTNTDMVSFNWNEVLGYDFEVTYTVNGQNPISNIESSNSFEVDNLNPQDQVEISVTILNNGICGNSETVSQTCSTQTCPPIELSIDNLSNEYCSNEASTALIANIGGGIFYVNGNESSILEPAILGEGIHFVEYILTQENCTYNTEITVNIENPIEALTINCGNTETDMVSFNWNEVLGYDFEVTYTVNGENLLSSTTNDNTFEITDLNPQDEVELTVMVLNNGICGNSESSTAICTAQNCEPIVLAIENIDAVYCSNAIGIPLTANIEGGTFYINGNLSTVFDPAILGEGIFMVEYILEQNNCSYNTNTTIEIVAPLEAVTINCGNIASDIVSFNWNEAVGYDFEVTYTINGENPLTSTSNDNSFVVTDLNPEDMVELTVVVLSDDVCGNSSAATAMCTAQACDPLVLSIDNLANTYCSDEGMVTLEANIEGGTFYVNGNESTVFDPAILGAGSHLVDYILEQNGCMFDVQTTVDVVEVLEAVLVDCGEISDNSITFNWSESANATEYQVVLSGAITDNFTQTATTYTIGNLTATDEVTIEVTAMGAIDCANSEVATATCAIPLVQECLNLEELNQVLSFPTAFSPNQDGVNDDFQPAFPYPFSDYELMVFNRWGKKIFESREVDAAWDGVQVNTFQDAALGVYVWHLKATVVNDCGEEIAVERKGNVTLVR